MVITLIMMQQQMLLGFLVALISIVMHYFAVLAYYLLENAGYLQSFRINIKEAPPVTNPERRKQFYIRQVKESSWRYGISALAFYTLTGNLLFRQAGNPIVELIKMVIAHFITRFGAFAVHLAMHRIPCLIWLHKKHHEFKVTEMTAGSTYLSNPWELVLMEHLTQLIGCLAVGRLPFLSLLLIMCYNSMKGAVDHSSFSINNGQLDSIHHYVHHLNPQYNIAQFPYFDELNGSLKQYNRQDVIGTASL